MINVGAKIGIFELNTDPWSYSVIQFLIFRTLLKISTNLLVHISTILLWFDDVVLVHHALVFQLVGADILIYYFVLLQTRFGTICSTS